MKSNRIIATALVVAAMSIAAATGAKADNLSDMRIVHGQCAPISHIAEGPIGIDLTKRQSRFFCNAMVVMTYGATKNHTLVQFAQKESHHGQIVGYGGMMIPGQNILQIERIYLTNGVPTPVTEGFCKFFYTATRLSGVSCGAKVDQGARRTVPIIQFQVSPEQ